MNSINSIDDLKKDYESKTQGKWFSEGNIKFFNSRFSDSLFYCPKEESIYFISSEKFDSNSKRKYTIRKYIVDSGEIETIGDFQQYNSSQSAKRNIEKLIGSIK